MQGFFFWNYARLYSVPSHPEVGHGGNLSESSSKYKVRLQVVHSYVPLPGFSPVL